MCCGDFIFKSWMRNWYLIRLFFVSSIFNYVILYFLIVFCAITTAALHTPTTDIQISSELSNQSCLRGHDLNPRAPIFIPALCNIQIYSEEKQNSNLYIASRDSLSQKKKHIKTNCNKKNVFWKIRKIVK